MTTPKCHELVGRQLVVETDAASACACAARRATCARTRASRRKAEARAHAVWVLGVRVERLELVPAVRRLQCVRLCV